MQKFALKIKLKKLKIKKKKKPWVLSTHKNGTSFFFPW
jgi:hypothetical protein